MGRPRSRPLRLLRSGLTHHDEAADIARVATVIALTVASVKAQVIGMEFMGLRSSPLALVGGLSTHGSSSSVWS